jgi:hypothetical protein
LQRLRLALLSRWPRRSCAGRLKRDKTVTPGAMPGCGARSGFERDGARKLLDPRFKCICYPGEKPPSLARDRARPGAKGIGRGFHRACDVFGAAPRHLGDWAPVRRSSTSSHSSETLSTHLPPINIRSFLSAASSSRIFVTAGFSSASLLLGPGPPAALRPHFENHIMLARVLDHL